MEEFEKALALGEDFKLRSGETIKVFPAPLCEMKESMKLFDAYAGYSVQALFMPQNETALTAFEDLLLLASGQDDLRTDEGKRPEAVTNLLKKFGRIDDGGTEVRKYISRFLGLVPRNTGTEADSERQ